MFLAGIHGCTFTCSWVWLPISWTYQDCADSVLFKFLSCGTRGPWFESSPALEHFCSPSFPTPIIPNKMCWLHQTVTHECNLTDTQRNSAIKHIHYTELQSYHLKITTTWPLDLRTLLLTYICWICGAFPSCTQNLEHTRVQRTQ